MRIRITGGRVIDPANGVDCWQDLYVAEGRIAGLGTPPAGFTEERVIDATELVVCPGLVDICARLREPGEEHKGTIASETRAAACGGITTLCCPPDTTPVVDTPAVVELLRRRAKLAGNAWVWPLGALTAGLCGEQLSEMAALKAAGCVGVSNAARPVENTHVMRRAMEYAATHGLKVFLNPEDAWLGRGCVHEGEISARLGLAGIPETAETVIVARDLLLIEQSEVEAHFVHLSTARAVELVAEAQARGLPVTADVTAHHLHFTDTDVGAHDSRYHVRPPLRTQRDRRALRAGVVQGAIAAICSDHQPHEANAKLAPFADTEPGISGLETLLPLTLALVEAGVIGLGDAIARLTIGPARILGVDAGTLSQGAAADICVFDPRRRWVLEPARMLSCGLNTPLAGGTLTGRTRYTLLGGALVHGGQDSSHG